MNYNAIVIDDDPATRKDAGVRVQSLGHACDRVTCQNGARTRNQKNARPLNLLNQEILAQAGTGLDATRAPLEGVRLVSTKIAERDSSDSDKRDLIASVRKPQPGLYGGKM